MRRSGFIFLMIFAMITFLSSCEKHYANDSDDDSQDSVDTSGTEDASDYIWDASDIVHITLNGSSIAVDGTGTTVNGSVVTINAAGNYSVTGTLTNGQIIVDSKDSNIVRLILSGANITCSTSAPIFVKSAAKVLIVSEDNTSNYVTDGASYMVDEDGEPNAAIYSKSHLSLYGDGSLTVSANYEDGITGKDGLVVKSGTINVTAVDDGIRGKDYLIVKDADITVDAGGDGLKSDNDESAQYGYILVDAGSFDITSVRDAIQSESSLTINGGTFVIKNTGDVTLKASGSGYETTSSAGLKSDGNILIANADITITSTGKGGKGMTTNKNITITSGTVNVTTSGAGATYKNTSGSTDSYSASCIKADGDISVEGGDLTLSSSGSGGKGFSADGAISMGTSTSSPNVTITTIGAKFQVSGTDYCHPKAIVCTGAMVMDNGDVKISSSDDGIHSEKSITINNGTLNISKSVEGIESLKIYINGGNLSVTSSNDGFNATAGTVSGGTESNDGSCLYLNGGTTYVNCTNGDAIDSNGSVEMNGGLVIANGPAQGVEEAADFNGNFNMNGGFFVGAGSSSNMTKAMSSSSAQYNLFISSSSVISSSTLFHIQNSSGIDIVTFKPLNGCYKLLFSSSSLVSGDSYSIYVGGTSTGTVSNGLYSGGTYSGGALKRSFTISNKVTTVSF
jgi:trimeric autotransporter adhesin